MQQLMQLQNQANPMQFQNQFNQMQQQPGFTNITCNNIPSVPSNTTTVQLASDPLNTAAAAPLPSIQPASTGSIDPTNQHIDKSKARSSTGKGEQWFKRYNELKVYKAQHSNCNVPKRFSSNPALGTWVSNQRSLRRILLEGKPSHMTEDRIRLLEEIGFEWHPPTGPNAKQEEQWRQRCRELEVYRDEHGHCRVPTKNYPPNPALGQWVNDQRRQYRLMKQGVTSSMTNDRIRILETIGFEWYSSNNTKKSK